MSDIDGFEFVYTPRFGLTSEVVRRADGARVELNNAFANLQGQTQAGYPGICLSSLTSAEVVERLRDLGKLLVRINAGNLPPFDRVVLRDIRRNKEKISAFHDDRFTDRERSIGDLFAVLFGQSAYSQILSAVRPRSRINPHGTPHRILHDFGELVSSRAPFIMDPEIYFGESVYGESAREKEHVRTTVRRAFFKSREAGERFFIDEGFVRSFGDYVLDFLPDAFDFNGLCQGGIESLFASPAVLNLRRVRGNYEMDNSHLGTVVVHEQSHLLLQRQSEVAVDVRGLVMNGENEAGYDNLLHGVQGEGVAQVVEDFSLEFRTRNAANLGITPEELRVARLCREVYLCKKMLSAVYNVFREEESRKDRHGSPEHFNRPAAERLSDYSGIPWYGKNFDSLGETNLSDVITGPLAYFFGYVESRRTADSLLKRGFPRGVVLAALHSGNWVDPVVQREFIERVYLPAVRDGAGRQPSSRVIFFPSSARAAKR